MTKKKVSLLSGLYPRTNLWAKGLVSKNYPLNSNDWHWELTPKGLKALKRKGK